MPRLSRFLLQAGQASVGFLRDLNNTALQSMRMSHLVIALVALTFVGCRNSRPLEFDLSADIAPGGHPRVGFFVNPKFPGGYSVMTAARKAALPDSGYIALSTFWMGSDKQHDYVVFFAGQEIKGSFESIYYRYWIFVKKKTDHDWSNARIFDWPDVPIGSFNGPIDLLESQGKELGKPAHQLLKPTVPSDRGTP